MREFTDVFKALGDATRLRAFHLIVTAEHPVCVCELADALGLPQYRISKHLAILRQAGLVVDARVGTWVHYSPAPDASGFIVALTRVIKEWVESDRLHDDLCKLKIRLSLRVGDECVVGTDDPRVKEAFQHAGLLDLTVGRKRP